MIANACYRDASGRDAVITYNSANIYNPWGVEIDGDPWLSFASVGHAQAWLRDNGFREVQP